MINAKIVYCHALTPVHSGTGQAVAVIDLPIAREKATGFPIIPASSFKGVLRDRFNGESWCDWAFGRAPKEGDDKDQGQGGAITFTDLRILCLPVRSFYGTFAYATCPLILTRMKRDLDALGATAPFSDWPNVQDGNDQMRAALTDKSLLKHTDNKVYLEDLDLIPLDTDSGAAANAIGNAVFDEDNEKADFINRFAIVSNATFNFLSETATEISARVSLETDTKTVKKGQLWYEEAVPAETIFYGLLVQGQPSDQHGLHQLKVDKPIQIGGNATVGRGLCRVIAP